MVDVVGGDARDERESVGSAPRQLAGEVAGVEGPDRVPEGAVSIGEEGHVLLQADSDAALTVHQFEPDLGKDPRFSPRIRRRTTYFQYAAWRTISWIE